MKKLLFIFITTLAIVSCNKEKIVAEPVTSIDVPKLDVISDESFEKGKNISSFNFKSFQNGADIDFSQYKGKKVLVDFWASWCIPCIEMFPDFEKLKKDFDGKLVVVTFSFDPMPAKIKEIMEKNKVSFEVFQAPEALRDSGVLLPASFYVDENGNVKDTANGKHDYVEMKKFLEL